jgi:hypothetical protein
MRTVLSGRHKPKWNLHDLYDNREHNLFQSFIMEFTDIGGIQIKYYIRDANIADYDVLYGEHQYYGFLDPKTTKILYDVEDEPQMWSPFGVWGTDVVTSFIPMGTFYRDVSNLVDPKIGDVIVTEWNSRHYEIAHVDSDDKIFQLKKQIWVIIMRPYRFSEQSDEASTLSQMPSISAAGENEWIQDQSDNIENYDDVDSSIYGF